MFITVRLQHRSSIHSSNAEPRDRYSTIVTTATDARDASRYVKNSTIRDIVSVRNVLMRLAKV
jgi:hypothetical protein